MLRHLFQQEGLHQSHGLPHLDPIQTTRGVRRKGKNYVLGVRNLIIPLFPVWHSGNCLLLFLLPKSNCQLLSLTELWFTQIPTQKSGFFTIINCQKTATDTDPPPNLMPWYILKWRNSTCRQVKQSIQERQRCAESAGFCHRLKYTEDLLNFSGKGELDCLAELLNSVINGD